MISQCCSCRTKLLATNTTPTNKSNLALRILTAAPIKTVGFSFLTISPRSAMGSCWCAKGSLCSEIPPSGRSATMSPRESFSHTRFLASSYGTPSRFSIAIAIRLAIPRAASPAPYTRLLQYTVMSVSTVRSSASAAVGRRDRRSPGRERCDPASSCWSLSARLALPPPPRLPCPECRH